MQTSEKITKIGREGSLLTGTLRYTRYHNGDYSLVLGVDGTLTYSVKHSSKGVEWDVYDGMEYVGSVSVLTDNINKLYTVHTSSVLKSGGIRFVVDETRSML